MIELLKTGVSLLPVLIFLALLILLDSYKLVAKQLVAATIVAGAAAAALCAPVNALLVQTLPGGAAVYSRYLAPIVEESVKTIPLIVLFRGNRVGFMVDAAIYGFAVGAGFSLVENVFYLFSLKSANVVVWIIRGFGTAAMHAATMAMLAVITKTLIDRRGRLVGWAFLPGLLLAVATHSLFNHFILSPTLSTVLLMVLLPLLVVLVFQRSEKVTEEWLGVGFDADQDLMGQLTTGEFSQTRIGQYLHTLQAHFPPAVVVDMFCLLRIRTELALRAKGVVMMRQAGIDVPPDPELREKFEEMAFLERSIGKTGMLAMRPFLHTSTRDLWQLTTIK